MSAYVLGSREKVRNERWVFDALGLPEVKLSLSILYASEISGTGAGIAITHKLLTNVIERPSNVFRDKLVAVFAFFLEASTRKPRGKIFHYNITMLDGRSKECTERTEG